MKVISITTGATGTILKSFRKYLSNIPEKHWIKEQQKTAIWGTAHTVWKVVLSKYKTLNMRSNITCYHKL
jgi:hypothetical protein